MFGLDSQRYMPQVAGVPGGGGTGSRGTAGSERPWHAPIMMPEVRLPADSHRSYYSSSSYSFSSHSSPPRRSLWPAVLIGLALVVAVGIAVGLWWWLK